jgi:K+-sensing histidine kinase KdpD
VRDPSDDTSLVIATGTALVAIAVAALLVPVRDWLDNTNVALILVGLVVLAAAIAGRMAGVLAALAAAVSFNFFHTEPYRTLRIDDREDIITVGLIVIVGLAVGEVAFLHRKEQVQGRARARGSHDIEQAVGLLAAGATVDELWPCVRDALVAALSLTGATFRPGPPVGAAPTIDRAGRLHPLPNRFARGGFELPPGTCLPVEAGGRHLGCIVLAPSPGRGVSPEQRRLAAALADVLAVALTRADHVAPTSLA